MMGECWQARRLLLVLFVVLALSVQASPFDGRADGWDDDSGTSKMTAAFEVDGEVRHDWGQSNLREWDGAVIAPGIAIMHVVPHS